MYRDPDTSELATFTKHVRIAETLFVINVQLGEQLRQHWDAETRHACAMSWMQLWEQLGQARAIAARYGRDVTRVDAARRCGNPEALDLLVSRAHRDAAVIAFAEVRRCMPEVVVPTEIPVAERPASPRVEVVPSWLLWMVGGTIFLLVALCARL